MLVPWKKSYDQPRQHIKKQRHYFASKGLSSQGYSVTSSQVWVWELDHKESWVPKNWCFWTVVLEKALESPLDCKEIQPVNPKGNQSWIFTGRTDAEAETPTLWPFDVKNWLIDAGKDWGLEKKGMTEDEMVGWHHWFNGYEFEQTPGVGDDRDDWCAVVLGVSKSRTRLSDWTELKNWFTVGDFSSRYSWILQNVWVSLNLYIPESIIGPAWIQVFTPRTNNKTTDSGNHFNGERGKSKISKTKPKFWYLAIIESQDKRGRRRAEKNFT